MIANAQDGSGYNNANFATPPDGQKPRMRMYVWNVVSPNRDGDLESGIVVRFQMRKVHYKRSMSTHMEFLFDSLVDP